MRRAISRGYCCFRSILCVIYLMPLPNFAPSKEIGIPVSGKFLLVESRIRENQESWVVESGIQLRESGIPLTIGIQNPSSTDKYWNPVPGIRDPRRGVQNSRLSWISLHGASYLRRAHRVRKKISNKFHQGPYHNNIVLVILQA